MKQLATEAVILKRINFGEADRILTVLTSNAGRMSMLAKAVRIPKSKLAGGLELFSVSDINYIDGKSDLKTIVSTRLKEHFKNIVSNVDRTMAGYDFMKIVDSFTQHSDEIGYFKILVLGLESLNDLEIPQSVSEVWFFSKVLQINGSSINLEKPLSQSNFSEDQMYDFSYDDMSFFANKTGKFGPKHIKFLRLVERSNDPKQLRTINDNELLSSELQKIIKQSTMMHKA